MKTPDQWEADGIVLIVIFIVAHFSSYGWGGDRLFVRLICGGAAVYFLIKVCFSIKNRNRQDKDHAEQSPTDRDSTGE